MISNISFIIVIIIIVIIIIIYIYIYTHIVYIYALLFILPWNSLRQAPTIIIVTIDNLYNILAR